MFGSLGKTYLRRKPGRYPTYRTRGLKRFRPINLRRRRGAVKRRKGNGTVSTVLRYVDHQLIENKVTSSVGQAVSGHVARSISDMPGCAPWLNLFGQYRVNKIKLEFVPTVGERINLTETMTGSDINAEKPMFATSINRVSTSFPQDFEQIMTTGSVKYNNAGRYQSRYFTPACFETIYRPGVTATEALAPAYKTWISTNMADVPHHGVSYVISAASNIPTGMYKYRIITTMYCQFKNKRVNTDNLDLDLDDK